MKIPVMIPTRKAKIIRNLAGTTINSNVVITRHINTAKNETMIIKFLFFIISDIRGTKLLINNLFCLHKDSRIFIGI